MGTSRAAVGLCWLLTGLFHAPVAANGAFETFGASARGKAMANAQTALGGGAEAAHYNPAALRQSRAAQMWAQLSFVFPGVSVETAEPPDGPQQTPQLPRSYSGVLLGLVLPVREVLDDRLTLGVVAYLPTAQVTHASPPDPLTPYFYLFDTAADHYEVEPALSLAWFDWLSTGVGVRLGAYQIGEFDLSVDPLTQTVQRQRMVAEQHTIVAPTAGLQLGPFSFGDSRFAIGYSYRERLVQMIAVQSLLDIAGADTTIYLPLVAATNFSPRAMQLGGAYEVDFGRGDDNGSSAWFAGTLQLACDISYAFWSEAPNPFLNVGWAIQGDGAEDLGIAGRLDAPGPGRSRVGPVGFRDTLTLKAGAEYKMWGDALAIRVGYAFRPSPVPDQTSGTNIIDADAQTWSGGLAAQLPVPMLAHPLGVEFAWQTQLLSTRTARKENPSDPVGDWRAKGTMSELTLGVGYAF